MADRTCSVSGCERKHKGRGYCSLHLDRLRRSAPLGGPELYPPGTGRLSPNERFWAKVEKTPTCWLWRGALTSGGYGNFVIHRGTNVAAHRFAYELLVGPIPEGLVLDHLCRLPLCVNPEHLEPVTERENIRRGDAPTAILSRENRCAKGHRLTGSNVYVDPRGWRHCRICTREARRTLKARRRSAA